MPFYDFKCIKCNAMANVHFNFKDTQEVKCKCGADMEKVFYPVGVIFNGTGWAGKK